MQKRQRRRRQHDKKDRLIPYCRRRRRAGKGEGARGGFTRFGRRLDGISRTVHRHDMGAIAGANHEALAAVSQQARHKPRRDEGI